MTWILSYFLVGFALHFLGSAVWQIPVKNGWKNELVCVCLWPLSFLLAAYNVIKVRIKPQVDR